jgi:putative aldouronate transport system permease protein
MLCFLRANILRMKGVSRVVANSTRAKKALRYLNRKKYLYILLIPCVIYFFIFNYIPMYGIIIAFKDFNFAKGIIHSPWVGFEHFKYMFGLSDFYQVFWNSFYLGLLRLVFTFPFPIMLALLLNEIRQVTYQRLTQTIIYLPHFISWVVIGGILVNFLSPSWGLVNIFLKQFGFEEIFFLADVNYFRPIVVLSSIWKEAGWGSIIFLAAITGINSELYEAASIDGASRLQRIWYVTVPGIKSTIMVLFILRLGHIMGNGFEQIFVLQNPMNLSVSEVFETYSYRVGLLGSRFSFGTTVGLFTSVIGLIFLMMGDRLAKMMKEDGIW